MAVIINGKDLTVEEIIRVCRGMEKVEIAPEAQKAVNKARAYIEKKLDEGAIIYGLTTGFGKFANVFIAEDETADLQKNLIMSHTCALGEPYEQKYVRAAMLLRCNALSRGFSGIRLSTIQTMVDMGPILFDYGYGPFRWVCLSGKPEDLDATDQAAMDTIDPNRRAQDRDNWVWIRDAKKNKLVVGTQARILYQDAEGRRDIALAFNKLVRDGKCGPIMRASIQEWEQ